LNAITVNQIASGLVLRHLIYFLGLFPGLLAFQVIGFLDLRLSQTSACSTLFLRKKKVLQLHGFWWTCHFSISDHPWCSRFCWKRSTWIASFECCLAIWLCLFSRNQSSWKDIPMLLDIDIVMLLYYLSSNPNMLSP